MLKSFNASSLPRKCMRDKASYDAISLFVTKKGSYSNKSIPPHGYIGWFTSVAYKMQNLKMTVAIVTVYWQCYYYAIRNRIHAYCVLCFSICAMLPIMQNRGVSIN